MIQQSTDADTQQDNNQSDHTRSLSECVHDVLYIWIPAERFFTVAIASYFSSSLRMACNSFFRSSVTSGSFSLRLLSVSRTTCEIISRAFGLSSAGMTNHGACSVLVALK